jgi:hypothetical protein
MSHFVIASHAATAASADNINGWYILTRPARYGSRLA